MKDNIFIKSNGMGLTSLTTRKLKPKEIKEISHLALIKQSRLSVMPIDNKSWKILDKMSKIKSS